MKKSIFASIFIFSVLFSFASCNLVGESKLSLNHEPLVAFNSGARNARVSGGNNSSMFFGFTENQRNSIMASSRDNGSASLCMVLETSRVEIGSGFKIGFLYSDDFDADGNLKSSISSDRPEVSGVYDFLNKNVQIEFAVDMENLPQGFYIKSDCNTKLTFVNFCKTRIGFEKSTGNSIFAFGKTGGIVDGEKCKFDFSSALYHFNSSNSSEGLMPQIDVKMEKTFEGEMNFTVGNDSYKVYAGPKSFNIVLQAAGFENAFSTWTFDSPEYIKSVFMKENSVPSEMEKGTILEPLVCDIGIALTMPKKNWRTDEYELFSWSIYPEVLFLDFKTLWIQSQFFTRLAYFVEKTGYIGTFVDDEFILTHHGYNAHDYKAVDLANFFTQAKLQDIKLNKRELLLRDILVKNEVIIPESNGTYKAGKGAVISVSRESNSTQRIQLCNHECWHGIYFMDEQFRAYVKDVFVTSNKTAVNFLLGYWSTTPSLMYDITDTYLIENEFMAYLLQQKLKAVASYFVVRSNWAKNSEQRELTDYVKRTEGSDFYDSAVRIDEFVKNKYGLECGRVFLITKE